MVAFARRRITRRRGGRIGLAVAGTRVYAMIQSARGLLWRSDDGGASWQFVTANTIVNERPFYFSRMGVDPANPNHAFALSVEIAETFDGGKTWKATGKNLGSDHHAIWILRERQTHRSRRRQGRPLSLDGGKRWVRVNLLPVAQAYHVSYDHIHALYALRGAARQRYLVRPIEQSERGRHSIALLAKDFGRRRNVGVSRSAGSRRSCGIRAAADRTAGTLWLYDSRSRQDIDISPYLRDQNVWAPKVFKYRFNWESPITFDPFDPHVAYYGGNVVFKTRDRGGLARREPRPNPEHQSASANHRRHHERRNRG